MLSGRVIPTTRIACKAAPVVHAEIISRNNIIKETGVGHVVVNDIQKNTDSGFVALVYKLTELPDTAIWIRSICRIPAFRGKVIMWVITPVIITVIHHTTVVIITVCFIVIVEINYRHELHMGDAKFFQVGNFLNESLVGTLWSRNA